MDNTNYLDRIRVISDNCSLSVFTYWNDMQNRYEFYVLHDFKPKSTLNNYHELTGQNITQIINVMLDAGFDTNVFMTRLREIKVENVKFATDRWYWFTSL